MQLALIPPTSLLSYTWRTHYQLMLPHLLGDATYAHHYWNLKASGKYIILDNGKAEAQDITNHRLIGLLKRWRPHEFVLPDVLGNADATVDAVDTFFEDLGERRIYSSLGIVAQGRCIDEALTCLSEIMDEHYNRVDVIYLPRLLVKPEDPTARLALAHVVKADYPDKPIHFLGAAPSYIREMEVAGLSGLVRSMDTSAPFNYAYEGSLLEMGEVISRPEKYFDQPASMFSRSVVLANVVTALNWSHTQDTGGEPD